MDFADFLREMLGITQDFCLTSIEKDEGEKVIKIHLKYLHSRFLKEGKEYKIYDYTPERTWQHLSWFEYRCYLVCSLPRYVSSEGKPKVIDISFAPKSRGYTHLFAEKIVEALQKVRVQSTVSELFQTSPYIVRSIMERSVDYGIEQRGAVTDLEHISLDEKAYTKGHKYATILIDSDRNYVVEMTQGRKEKNVKSLFYSLNEEEQQPSIKRANIDMWKPYMNALSSIAPQAQVVHDKFHLFKKLSDAIDQTRRTEVRTQPLLKKQRYTVLKNAQNRTERQQKHFEQLLEANLLTAKAWTIRENFKSLFQVENDLPTQYRLWKEHAHSCCIKPIDRVIETFDRHITGIFNAIETQSTSAKHENMNGKIQAVIAKARGFMNFERFRINVLFYFGKLNLVPQKIY